MNLRLSPTLLCGSLLVVLPLSSTFAQLPGFPGADGAGRFASGGRGGIVYHVTKLNSALDDPLRAAPGTFLYGLNDVNFPAGVPRTIVFDVAGTFHLGRLDLTNWSSGGNAWDSQSRQSIGGTNLTIAGQTAPGPVIFMGGTLKPSGSNIVIRNITVAAGYGMRNFWEPPPKTPPTPGTVPTSFVMDAFDVSGQNIIIDHADAFFCTDECISCNEKANKLTVQYCNSSQGQNYQAHALGHLLQANTDHRISLIHNLDAHLDNRLPRVGSEVGFGALNDFRNNVFYNWVGVYGYAGYAGAFANPSQYSKNNFINNFYLAGNGGYTNPTVRIAGGTLIFQGYQAQGMPVGPVYTAVYPAGNVQDTNKDGDPGDAVSADAFYFNSVIQPAAYDVDIGVTLDAGASFTNVLRHVGSRWWERDYDFTLGNTNEIDRIDERIIHETITGTGQVEAWADDPYDPDPNEGVEWRSLWALRPDTNGVAPFNRPADWDVDQDGMPGCWEAERGLDPGVANNNDDFDNDGFTDLEEYLNDVAAWPAPGQILFTGATNNRYALIHNWRVTGVPVNISGIGNLPTSSPWQPSRYDTAVISNAMVVVDAVGQHAGTLRLLGDGTLHVANGWLKANSLDIGTGCGVTVAPEGTLRLVGSGSISLGGGATFTNAGVLDIISWTGTLPAGLVNTGMVLDRSLIRVDSAAVNGQDFEVSLQGHRGHDYQLQVRNDASSGVWQNIGGCIYGAGGPITLTDSGGASGQQRYYRVAVD